MLIAVDAGSLGEIEYPQSGVSVVTFNILKHLSFIDKKNTYLLYSFSPISETVLSQFGSRMQHVVIRPKKLWLHIRLSIEMMLRRPDIFLGFGQALPFFHTERSIVFVYDLGFERFPSLYPSHGNRLRRQTQYAAAHAGHIVAISQQTKQDLVTLYHVPDEKITVVPMGVDPMFTLQSKKKIGEVLRRYGMNEPYFLFVGNLRPIKNAERIMEAFEIFQQKTKKPTQFVFIGTKRFGPGYKPAPAIKTSGDSGQARMTRGAEQMIFLESISQEDVLALYCGATALVSPSLYEGFGLTFLEAMASGCPVIGSTAGSIPEVVGDAGILVDPYDIDAIVATMEQMANDEALRKSLIQKGLNRAKNYSWKQSAEKLYKLL